MKYTEDTKSFIKQRLIESLKQEQEIQKIIIFGSFLYSENPGDIDIAVFQNSREAYLTLAMKYRRLTRDISRQIPVDIIPIRADASPAGFLSEIEQGELLYER